MIFRCLIEPSEEAHRNRVFLTYAGQVCKHVSGWISDLWITAGSPAALKPIPPDPYYDPLGAAESGTAVSLVPKFSSLEAAKQGFIAAAKAKTPILSKIASSVLNTTSSGKLTSQPARIVSSAPPSAYTSPELNTSLLPAVNKLATPGPLRCPGSAPLPRFQSLQAAKEGLLAAAKASITAPPLDPTIKSATTPAPLHNPAATPVPRFQSLQAAKDGLLAAAKASIPAPGKYGPQLPPPNPMLH